MRESLVEGFFFPVLYYFRHDQNQKYLKQAVLTPVLSGIS